MLLFHRYYFCAAARRLARLRVLVRAAAIQVGGYYAMLRGWGTEFTALALRRWGQDAFNNNNHRR